ncbi:hypothetical protein HPB47_022377, partial [Ixodes persulcatus]
KRGVCEVVLLGDAKAPEEIVRVLEKGPKFAGKANIKPQELLTLVRDVGDGVDQDKRDRCILDGVDTLPRQRGGVSSNGPKVGKVVSFCLNEHLKLLVADKEGGFALVAEKDFLLKGKQSVEKNFKEGKKVSLAGVKKRAVELCQNFSLDSLKASIIRAKDLNL